MHSKAQFHIVFVRHVIIDTHQNKVNCLLKNISAPPLLYMYSLLARYTFPLLCLLT